MRFRTYASSALMAVALLGFAACGKNDKNNDDKNNDTGDGDGDGDSTADEIAELQAQIDALEALLADGSANQDELQAALDAANMRLEQLETCGNGGVCETRDETIGSLSAISDAYCEWLFGCCSEDEARAGFGPAIPDVDACKAVYQGMMENGTYASYYVDSSGMASDLGYTLNYVMNQAWTIAERVEQGRVRVVESGIEACVNIIQAQECSVTEGCYDWSQLQACEGFLEGLQKEGEPCAGTGECEEGLRCDTSEGDSGYGVGLGLDDSGVDGSCVPEPEVGDACVRHENCSTADGNLYCDAGTGACAERPGEGDSCAFSDGLFFEGFAESVPCQFGYECSLTDNTCQKPCAEGTRCYRYTDPIWECGAGLTCNVTDNREGTGLESNYSSYGYCDTPKTAGEEATQGSECESGNVYLGECEGLGGEDCSVSGECASGVCDTTCATYCGGDFADACGSTEYCEGIVCGTKVELGDSCDMDAACNEGVCAGGTCQAVVARGGDCLGYQDLCPATDFCEFTEVSGSGYECSAKKARDAGCSNSFECGVDLSCVEGTCLPYNGRDEGDYCSDWYNCASGRCASGLCVTPTKEAGDDCVVDTVSDGVENTNINYDECENGLFCKRSNPKDADDMTGVCTTQGAPGNLCDNMVLQNVRQCQGNAPCSYHDELNQRVCPVVVEGDDDYSCMIEGIPYDTSSGDGPGPIFK